MHKKTILPLIVLIIIPAFAAGLMAQNRDSTRAVLLLEKAAAAREQGSVKEARSAYKKLLKIPAYRKQALVGLGELAFEEQKWKVVEDVFDKVAKQDPADLSSWYYLAIAKREIGIFRPILVRRMIWNKSRDYFRKIIAQDEQFRDVYYQFAILQRYRKKYEEAIELGHRQITLRPDDTAAQLGLFRLYKYMITHRDAGKAMAWLENRDSAYDRFFAGELLRRQGELEQALRRFDEVPVADSTFSLVALALARAKVWYQKGDPARAQKLVFLALDQIKNSLDCGLVFNDFKYILSDDELQQYETAETPGQCAQFFRTLWRKRDPLPAEAVNPRLTEHYRRLLYAEENYVFDGFKAWVNNPDKSTYLKFPRSYALNDEFNDKGLIYLRHGPPDDRIVTVGESVPRNESWLYYPRAKGQQVLTFHFIIDELMGKANNWRLSPVLYDQRMLEDRLQWGNIYHKMLTATPLERLSYEVEMADQSKESVREGLSTDRHTWEKKVIPFSFPIRVTTFRGRGGKHQVSIAYALPVSELQSILKDGYLEVEMGAVLRDSLWQEVTRSVYHLRQRTPRNNTGRINYLINGFELKATPGVYHAAFHARPSDSNMLAGYQFDVVVPDYDSDTLQVSDILLASVIEDAGKTSGKFIRKGLRVIPNPTVSYPRTAPVHVYLEIYHMQPDDQNRVRYRIEYSMDLKKRKSSGVGKLFTFWRRSKQNVVSVASDRESTTVDPIEFIALDVQKAVAGEYELRVRVTDKESGRQVVKTARLELR